MEEKTLVVIPKERKDRPRRLKRQHKKAIRLFYAGLTPLEAATELNVNVATVYRALDSEAGQDYAEKVKAELELELKGMTGLYNEVIRKALRSTDARIALAGASLFSKNPLIAKEMEREENTAEDVVKQMMDSPSEEISSKQTNLLPFIKKTGTDGNPI